MPEQDILKLAEGAGNPPGDAGAPPTPSPEAAEAERLRRENESLKKQTEDQAKFITDLQSTTKTLEDRIKQIGQPGQPQVDLDVQKEAQQILETAQIDPVKASQDLARLLASTQNKATQAILSNLSPIIEQQTYVNKVKSENQDLIDLGLEAGITLRAGQLIQSGKTFKEAVDNAVLEARKKVDKLKSNAPPVPPTPPPAGAVGEGEGSLGPPPPPPPPKEPTEADEVKAERERRRKQGL